jgi:hypothetical protein
MAAPYAFYHLVGVMFEQFGVNRSAFCGLAEEH